jgi:hypothetical protein
LKLRSSLEKNQLQARKNRKPSMQSTQAPAYHMRMMDLVASHRAAYKSTRARLAEMELHLNTAQAGVRSAELELCLGAARTRLRKLRSVVLSDLSKNQEKEKAALRQKHRDTRAREKAEKAFIAKSKLEPEFWTYYPNHDGRRDTMEAVLKSLSMPVVKLDQHMPAYAEWLLTAKKTNEKGSMDRWELMEAFVTSLYFA